MTLSTLEKILFLRGVELFGSLTSEELAPVARIAQETYIEQGERFITQGELGDCLYVVVAGEARIVIDGVGEVGRRQAKSVIGEMAIISRNPRAAHCYAVTDITALKVAYADFWLVMDEQPHLARGAIEVLAKRLNEAVANLSKLSHAAE